MTEQQAPLEPFPGLSGGFREASREQEQNGLRAKKENDFSPFPSHISLSC